MEFGFPLSIKYETGDPSLHYLTSKMFAKEDMLLNATSGDEIYNDLQGRKIGSYVNSGLIMKCFAGSLDEVDYYNIFIAFGIFILFLTGVMMYNALEKFAKNRYTKIIALVVSIIFMMGYPLNSLLFGFEYLSLGILVLCTIIHMVYYFEKEELKFRYILITFALLNFGLFCSYYMFVPFTYSALWIYFCIYNYRKKKKIFCKDNIIILSVTLIIPFILGYIYHLAPGIYNIFCNNMKDALEISIRYSSNILNNSFSLEGYTYTNYYSNILPFIPLVIYYIIQKYKKKEIFSFEIILTGALVIFISILLIGNILGKVSEYFIMKNYFALWIILIYINFLSLIYIFEKDKKITYAIITGYTSLIILCTILINMPITKSNQNERLINLAEIFEVNKYIIAKRPKDLEKEEINILKCAKEIIDFSNEKTEIIGDEEQIYWAYSLLEYTKHDEMIEEDALKYGGQYVLYKKYMDAIGEIGKSKYIIYFKKNKFYDKIESILFNNAEIIYQNNYGGILKYN